MRSMHQPTRTLGRRARSAGERRARADGRRRRGLRRVARLAFWGGVVVATTAVAAPAQARPARLDFEAGAQVVVHHLTTVPTMTLADNSGDMSFRSVRGSLPGGDGSLTTVGGLADVSILFDDRYRLVLGGFGAYGAVGPSPRVLTTIDGSPAELRPWTSARLDFVLPGLDMRFKHRRWMFAVGARGGIAVLWMSASIVSANAKEDLSPSPYAASAFVRGNVEVCRRLDPVQRACVVAAPSLYDYGWFTGAQLGLRWEWGP